MNALLETSTSSVKRPFGIGGSDVAAILGLSPYKSAVELWSELVSRQPSQQRDMLHLRFGQFAESFVASEYERQTCLTTISRPGTIFHRQHGYMFGHVDRFVLQGKEGQAVDVRETKADDLDPLRVLECKTASAFSRSGWGEPGTDRVPAQYLVQCAWYMALTGCEEADLAALIGNSELRVYSIRRDRQLEALILLQAQRFWCDHVLAQCPPDPASPADAALLFPKDAPGTLAEATPAVLAKVREYAGLSGRLQQMSQECERLRTEILAYMGSRERLTHRGRTLATWRCPRPSRRLDAKSLSAAHPEIAREFTHTVIGGRRFLLKEVPGDLGGPGLGEAEDVASVEASADGHAAEASFLVTESANPAQAAGELP